MEELSTRPEQSPPSPGDRSPLWLGVIGLVLLFAGWQMTTYIPPSRHQDVLDTLHRAGDENFRRKLGEYERGWSRPPLELPGRLLFFVGLVLFVIAGAKMYYAPSPARPVEEPASPGGEERWS